MVHSTMSEPDFLREVAAHTGSGLLLDISNICISAINHNFEPMARLPEAALITRRTLRPWKRRCLQLCLRNSLPICASIFIHRSRSSSPDIQLCRSGKRKMIPIMRCRLRPRRLKQRSWRGRLATSKARG